MRLALAALALAATFGLSLGFGSFMPNPGRQEERDRCVAAAAGDVAQTMAKHAIREFLLDNGKRDLGELYDLRTYTNASGVVHYPYVFSKTLAHDPTTGFPAKADVDRVLHFVSAPCTDNLDAIKLAPGHERKLEGVATVWNRNPVGADPPEMAFPIWYPIESAESAFEMAEVYGMSLLRDVPFAHFGTDPMAARVLDALNRFVSKTTAPTAPGGAITAATLFRGAHPGETVGPYISQFLYTPYAYGGLAVRQAYADEADPTSMLDLAGWVAVQNGAHPGPPTLLASGPSYAATARTLGSMVHGDPLYQFFYAAAQCAAQAGIGTEGFVEHAVTTAWTTSGGVDVLAAVAHVALGALHTSWWQKWAVGMRIRPEVYAQRYELTRTHPELAAQVPGLSALKANLERAPDLIEAVLDANEARTGGTARTALLAGLYPEGSPTHPSLPAGHAVVAGACVTVLKAMLRTFEDEHGAVETTWLCNNTGRQAVHSLDGQTLEAYEAPDAAQMTVNGELNKLASNVALGRDWAGVHYRADGDGGLLAGEEYAITYLLDRSRAYREAERGSLFAGWTLQKFDGSVIKITPSGVDALVGL